MKLLLDQNISYRLVSILEPFFPGAAQVKRLGLTDKTDREIWTFAKANDYILVTFDSDFYDLSMTFGSPPKLIWITAGNLTTRRVGDLLIARVDDIRAFFHDPELTCLVLQ